MDRVPDSRVNARGPVPQEFGGTAPRRISRRRALGEAGGVLLATSLLPSLAQAAGAAADGLTAGGPLSDPAAFLSPPVLFRPRWRWWWGEPYLASEFADEIAQFAAAGFGAAEISFTNTIAGQLAAETAGQGAVAAWGTPDQREMLTASLTPHVRTGSSSTRPSATAGRCARRARAPDLRTPSRS